MKRTRVKRQSKKNPLVRECDNLVRAIVFDRDDYTCQRSGIGAGSGFTLDPAHVFAKARYQNIRHLDINIVTLTREWHRYFEDHPKEFLAWFSRRWPDRYEELLRLKDTIRNPDLKDLRLELLARQPEIASVPVKRMGWTDSELPF
jgi:hypothetical protein